MVRILPENQSYPQARFSPKDPEINQKPYTVGLFRSSISSLGILS
jgi:hypothetical protein